MIKEFKKENLNIKVFSNRKLLGKNAADNVSGLIKELLKKQDEVRIIFGSAPSQDEFIDELVKCDGIEWKKITAFHMDEYIGLGKDSPRLFSKYLQDRLFSKVPFKEVNIIEPFENPEKECRRYEARLKEKPIDIICLGIGENGHIAFNDPPVADFKDPYWVKIVELDNISRQQQVNDKCFASIDEVPAAAVTLTIPAMISGRHLSAVVPGIRKAPAVRRTIIYRISTECPATILRTHKNAILYLDINSASEVLF